ncbi:MAG: flagellin, partial [Oscillospiraceae bacterium]
MIIQHNIMALNSYNRLGTNNGLIGKNLEKLSSGYKINRAGDDAAGLAISEKMRAQITGLTRATQNSQDGVSLVQTAEGNLTEVHSMLNRMVDLATQSSNGTIDDSVDRANLQKEVTSLKSEINRIAESSHFNGIKLLDGSLGATGKVSITNKKAATAYDFSKMTKNFEVGSTVTVDTFDANGTKSSKTYEFTKAGGTAATGNTAVTLGANVADSVTALAGATDPTGASLTDAGGVLTITSTVDDAKAATISVSNAGLMLQIGDTAAQRVGVSVGSMGATALDVADVDVGTEAGATKAIDKIKAAINTVSGTRADLGAIQNRLEHTINNLTTTTE